MSAATQVTCKTCGRQKAPRGRSVPLALAGTMCTSHDPNASARMGGCPDYYEEPRPDCRWPGELTCGPGCNKDRT